MCHCTKRIGEVNLSKHLKMERENNSVSPLSITADIWIMSYGYVTFEDIFMFHDIYEYIFPQFLLFLASFVVFSPKMYALLLEMITISGFV